MQQQLIDWEKWLLGQQKELREAIEEINRRLEKFQQELINSMAETLDKEIMEEK